LSDFAVVRGEVTVEEKPAAVLLDVELALIYERARRAVKRGQSAFRDLRFILWWRQMRPRPGVSLAPLLE
jgi:hypothetical protein